MSAATTSLLALNAVSIDTETTSLDVKRARIVQLGAQRVVQGQVPGDGALEVLVNPGEPIPPASSQVHGIVDDGVVHSARFAEAWEQFRPFLRDDVLIGHTIGYDLAVLAREAGRAGIPWKQPRSLCVRMLAQIARPDLPDHSLETLAAWLGIAIHGRHTALGDATAAAEIFIALLPKLRAVGIRTLGEADRAVRRLEAGLDGSRAGWAEPSAVDPQRFVEAIDPFAYRHRVSELMAHPPIVVKAETVLHEAIEIMVGRKVGSLLVSEAGQGGEPISAYGIATERDLLRHLASEPQHGLGERIGEVVSRPVHSIRATAFAYRAFGRMDRLGIRHLAVRDDRDRLVGMLSARDLLRLRATSAIDLDDRIEQSTTSAQMAEAWSHLPAVAQALLAEDVDASLVAEIISEELCALTRGAAIIAEREMAQAGRGAAPCAYAVLVLGSGGRGESLLAADQDNAIVFAAGDPGGREDAWFAELGSRLADVLDAAGVPYCKGGVMAKNASFRGSLESWKSRVDAWVRRARPEDLLNVDIFFDLRPVHGDVALAAELLDHAYAAAHQHPAFAKLLGETVSPSNPFGYLDIMSFFSKEIDLKLHGLFPLVATARALSIRHGIRARSTRARLEKLRDLALGGDADLTTMVDDHRFLVRMLLEQQVRDAFAGLQSSNRVSFARLSGSAQARLKEIVRRAQRMPDLLRDLMFAGG